MPRATATTGNKFEKNLTLSHKDIRGKRATAIAEDVKIAQEDIIRELSDSKRALNRKLLDLEDLSPDNELSLHPGRKDFNAKLWAKEVQDTKVALVLTDQKLKIAEETLAEYF